jgi:beta-glucosidase
MTFQGEPLIDLEGVRWGSLPSLKTVSLERGRRYPIEIAGVSETGSAGIGLAWKRISEDPAAALREAAANADVLVAVVGLTSDLEAEESPVEIPGFAGGDKTTIDIPSDQQAMLEVAAALDKPLVMVAMNGSPINLAWAKANANAILEAWYPGQAGGLAIANALSGKANPSGRLPLTFYRTVDQLPAFDDYRMEGRTYRYYQGETVYPFGHGLSYTRFAYGPLTVTPASANAGSGIRVETVLRNVGDRDGDEVAQLYLTFPDRPGVPNIALRGFRRVHLAAGESRRVRFDLSPRDLSAVDPEGIRKVVAGEYRVFVGSGQPETGAAVSDGAFAVGQDVDLPR